MVHDDRAMNRTFATIRHRAAMLAFAIVMLVPLTAPAQTDAVDLTATFAEGGITIDRLLVYQIGGIVLIRGRTGDPVMALEAGRFAIRLGYQRVANLIEVLPALADDAIEGAVRRRLQTTRALEGCTFEVDAKRGVVGLRGRVTREVQKGYAIHLVGRIDGVKSVHSNLTVLASAVAPRKAR